MKQQLLSQSKVSINNKPKKHEVVVVDEEGSRTNNKISNKLDTSRILSCDSLTMQKKVEANMLNAKIPWVFLLLFLSLHQRTKKIYLHISLSHLYLRY